jgi:general secretion pathway protein B
MSYILDALRKADAQRERDAGRGIHAQPALAAAPAARAAAAPRLATLGALAAGILIAAAGGWYFTRSSPAPAVEEGPAGTAAPVTAATPPRTRPVVANAIVPSPAPAPAAPAPTPLHEATSEPPQPVQAAPATPGLPPDAPKVTISGGVYSPDPAQRMLIVNGQVFNEGSEVAPGLAIEKIEARTATLKFRGARYTVAY